MMKYFDEQDLIELIKYDPKEIECKTLSLINEKHAFEVTMTPSIAYTL